jgi:polyhydroxybutyrate depolymerase
MLATLPFADCGSATQLPKTKAKTANGTQASSLTVRTADGRLRSYIVYAPPGGARRSPLVLVFHGAEDTAEGTAQETDFLQVAAQDGFVVAFLQGYEDTWNEGAGHTPAEVAHVNDVEFTSEVLTQIERSYSIDRTRVAAVGLSNGALLTELLGCRLADRLTLIAPIAGQLPVSVSPTCRPARPISVLEMHGTADQAIPYGGGHFVGVGGGTTVLSAPASAARWASLDGCKSHRQTADAPQATLLTAYSACHDHVTVALRSLQGAGHGWPEDVGLLIAEFLGQHPGAPAK